MKTRVLNKQGKDYSHKSASAIQEEYLSMNSTHETILQARKRVHSATNPFEVEEARSDPTPLTSQSDIPSYTRQLLTDRENQADDVVPQRQSADLSKVPVVMATPSLFSSCRFLRSFAEAFNLLDLSKKHRRAMSIGSLLETSTLAIQYFNPEFDPASGE